MHRYFSFKQASCSFSEKHFFLKFVILRKLCFSLAWEFKLRLVKNKNETVSQYEFSTTNSQLLDSVMTVLDLREVVDRCVRH